MAEQEPTKRVKSEQWHRRNARVRRLAEMRATKRVRVVPRDETIRRDIKHMPGGIMFPAEGSVEWPLDQFTKRRLRDGTVTLESPEDQKARQEELERARRPQQHRRSSETASS